MSCWLELGIAPTADIEAIKKAFAAQSKQHHPEDDPEGFSRLRQAYRSALQLAKGQPDGPQESPSSDMTAKHEPASKHVPKPPVPSPETLNFDALTSQQAPTPGTKAGLKQDDVYDFTAVERAKVPEESYSVGTFAHLPTGLPKQIERQRRKLRNAARMFKTLEFLGTSFVFLILGGFSVCVIVVIIIAKLGASPDTFSTQIAVDTSAEYRETIMLQAEEILRSQAANRKQAEIDLIQNQILPAIKLSIMDDIPVATLELGSMVGMSYLDCSRLSGQFEEDHDEEKLEQALNQYTRLVPSDRWISLRLGRW
jgi:hypothetical protein